MSAIPPSSRPNIMNAASAPSAQKTTQGKLAGRSVKDLTQAEKNRLTERLKGIEQQSSLAPGTLSLERLMKTHKTVEEILEVIAIYEKPIPSGNNSFEVTFPQKKGEPPLLQEKVSKQSVIPLAASIYEKQGDARTAESIRNMQDSEGVDWISSAHARAVAKEKAKGLRDSAAVPAIRVNARQHTITFPKRTMDESPSYKIDRGAALTNFSDGDKNLEDLRAKGINDPEYKTRRNYLDCLMLQRLQSAVEIEPEGRIAASNQLNIFQVSTMTETKKELKSGTVWNEENFMKDMAEIFDQFDGKDIYFDVEKAPSVERNSKGEIVKIYLLPPPGLKIEKDRPVRLQTIFFNYGVQGKIPKENSVQGQINQKGFNKLSLFVEEEKAIRQQAIELVSRLKQHFLSPDSKAATSQSTKATILESYVATLKELNNTLNNPHLQDFVDYIGSGQDVTDDMYKNLFNSLLDNPIEAEFDRLKKTQEGSYDTVTNFLEFAQKHGFSIGVNCASGKDRTGYSIIKFISRLASKNITNFEKVKSKLQRHLLQPHSTALQVAYENINIRVLKLKIDVLNIKKSMLEGESIADFALRALKALLAAT